MSPSTFASAAASGNNANSPRPDASDWSRRPNGATQTFRRPSAAQTSSAAPPSVRNSVESVPAYIPPHRNGTSSEYRYSKDQLLSLFRAEKEAGNLSEGLSSLFVSGWESNLGNGINTSPWARRDDQRDSQTGADICWDKDGSNVPLGLKDLSADEKELFTSSVNSPIKPPTQSKDAAQGAPRKTSLSGPQSPGGFGLASPTRPTNRRRDTSESYPFPPAQPSQSAANPPAALIRRRTDFGKEPSAEPEDKAKEPFALKGKGAAATPWGSSRFSPIGNAFGIQDASDAAPEKRPDFGSLRESRFKAIMQEAEEEEDRQSRNASSVRYDDPWRDRRALGDPFPSEPSRAEILQLPEDIAGVAPVVGKGDEAPQKTPYRGNGARSPTDTNPYTSPENDKTDDEVNIAFPGLGGFAPEDGIGNINNVLGLGSLGRAFDAPTDRSQSSSRGLGALPGLGSASAWAPGLPTAGTPSRDRPPLASFESLFPVDNGTYPSGFPPPGGFRPRLGQMLPQGMTDLEGLFDPAQDFSGLARPFGLPARETESPMRAGRNIFDDISGDEKPDAAFTTGTPPSIAAIAGRSGSFPPSLEAQMRTMVMPDRMKWQYKDHHGTTQGPFSGLEMHDWYKAGYFSPELLIKKLEDPDFEPLAQLIRKIGNSREPFLVPQVGIPHDPPPQRIFAGPSNAGGVQPPFPNSFPSFGTTLTAEQQNDLERRKQESQFLMARQKEHLAQQQLLIKMQQQIHPQPHGVFPPLNHQGSTPSLHSQPSFGNIAGAGFPPGQPMPGQMDGSFRPEAMPEDVAGFMERLVIGRTNQPPVQNDAVHAQQVEDMLNDRARLQQEQDAETQHMMQNDSSLAQAAAERHQQFHQLQSEEHVPSMPFTGQPCIPLGVKAQKPEKKVQEQSITQQVQAAVSAKSAQPIQWTRVDPTTMQPIAHPPQSSSPMPAPVAQRRQNVADTLTASSPSPAHTPSAETPSASVAPWAKEVAEVPKGPSLREIQEAEAKRAAQKEEIATAARRAALEKEVLAQQQAAAAAAQNPGLPSTSTWASGSNAPPANSSVWSKPAPVARNAPAISKKTLAQIQKEEEARKTKVTQTATAAVPSASGTGKRYADLASKNAPAQAASNGAWTTVGAGGKVKGAVPPSAPARTVSSSVAAPPRPKAASRSATIGNQAVPARGDAMEEFKKWAVKELRAHLDKSINVESFVDNLQQLGLDPDVLTEAVHFASTTIDSRHFTAEFIRRHKLAEKGVAPEPSGLLPSATGGAAATSSGAAAGNGGWSEVAKKGGSGQADRDATNGNFRVVQGKRRDRRR